MADGRDEIANLSRDLERYGSRPWLREQSIWAVAVYRLGRAAETRPQPVRWIVGRLYWPVYRLVETLTGISLPKAATIGPGLRIHHFGGIVIHPDAVIGAECTMRHGVTIGRGARIGAMSVVLVDVPPGAAAVGNPARIT
jgi:serine O-acetyltransferase